MRLALFRTLAGSSLLLAIAGGCDSNPDAPTAPSPSALPAPRPGASKAVRATRQVGPPLGSPSP